MFKFKYMKICIICDTPNEAKSIEHIIPESMGNTFYVLEKGDVCDPCNNRMAEWEEKVLTKSVLQMERARFAVRTKKGKNAKGVVGGLEIKGDENFKKYQVNVSGLNNENSKSYDPKTKTFKLTIKGFDKCEAATSRFLLMLGLESLYKSQRKIFKKYDFKDAKDYIQNKTNQDWGFITADLVHGKFESVPRFGDKMNLKKIECELLFQEKDAYTLLFKLRYGGISMVINLLGRTYEWSNEYFEKEDHVQMRPIWVRKSK